MPPLWWGLADCLAENIPTCKMVIGSCITELVSLSDQKTRLCTRKNNANFAKAICPVKSIIYKYVMRG